MFTRPFSLERRIAQVIYLFFTKCGCSVICFQPSYLEPIFLSLELTNKRTYSYSPTHPHPRTRPRVPYVCQSACQSVKLSLTLSVSQPLNIRQKFFNLTIYQPVSLAINHMRLQLTSSTQSWNRPSTYSNLSEDRFAKKQPLADSCKSHFSRPRISYGVIMYKFC
jgi:hypothetical protein